MKAFEHLTVHGLEQAIHANQVTKEKAIYMKDAYWQDELEQRGKNLEAALEDRMQHQEAQ
jgi:hypothetical protein